MQCNPREEPFLLGPASCGGMAMEEAGHEEWKKGCPGGWCKAPPAASRIDQASFRHALAPLGARCPAFALLQPPNLYTQIFQFVSCRTSSTQDVERKETHVYFWGHLAQGVWAPLPRLKLA